MAAKTQLSTLPAELRSEIWSLALRPSPGVYRCDPSKFIPIREREHPLDVEDTRWLIPKRRYPTVMHLCRESRLLALGAMDKEVQENLSLYCIGQDTRPFIPEIDTFWFDDHDDGETLLQADVVRERGAIGSRVHTIRNLAVSAAVVRSSERRDSASYWDQYMFQGIGRFENLRRIDVVFGPVPIETLCDGYETDKDCWAAGAPEQVEERDDGQVVLTRLYDVPELQLAEETRGWGFETTGASADEDQDRDPEVVKKKLDRVRADVYEGFEKRASYLAMYPPSPGSEDEATAAPEQGQQQSVAEVFPWEKDLSEVTFHAARMVETARFRGRTIRKSFPSWYFTYNDDEDPFEPSSSHRRPATQNRLGDRWQGLSAQGEVITYP